MSQYTTISLKPDTLAKLATICKKTQSYDEFIQDLIKTWEAEN